MSTIICRNLSFSHPAPATDVFSHLELLIDTQWRAGLVGRNGRGKTTLMKLIARELTPDNGELIHALTTHYFPFHPSDPGATVFSIVKNAVAPFDAWERRLETLLAAGTEQALSEYAELLTQYERHGGYTIDARVAQALDRLDIDAGKHNRPFMSLSGGEQTRALIASLFVMDGCYPLIDEPTNHLDLAGREIVADYLADQHGFLVVSHDRAFLDSCIDHVVAIQREDVVVHAITYSEWLKLEREQQAFEQRRSDGLKREIRALSRASAQRREGALARERDKAPHVDKGYVGHRAAKQMKRALAIERRIERQIEERKSLLRNAEKSRTLKLDSDSRAARDLIVANNLTVLRDGRPLFEPVSFNLASGDRLAILGRNGSGKSSLLTALNGGAIDTAGVLKRSAALKIRSAAQIPTWTHGAVDDHLAAAGLDGTRFRHVMATIGVSGELLKHRLETLSAGELKKIELARTLLEPADVLIWDEPLNYIDVESRLQIEALILDAEPTLIFVEHDRYFIEQVATDVLALNPLLP